MPEPIKVKAPSFYSKPASSGPKTAASGSNLKKHWPIIGALVLVGVAVVFFMRSKSLSSSANVGPALTLYPDTSADSSGLANAIQGARALGNIQRSAGSGGDTVTTLPYGQPVIVSPDNTTTSPGTTPINPGYGGSGINPWMPGLITPTAPSGGNKGPVSTYSVPNPNQKNGAGYVKGGTTKGVGATIPVDLSGPSNDTNTYVQQLFAIESGAQIPAGSLWPSEATNPAWRRQTLIQFVASLVGSGSYYNPQGTYLSSNQVLAAESWNQQSPLLNTNPVYAQALTNAAAVAAQNKGQLLPWDSGGSPLQLIDTGSYGTTPVSGMYAPGATPTVTSSAGAPSSAVMTLRQFNEANRAATIARNPNANTQQINAQIASNYDKYKKAAGG